MKPIGSIIDRFGRTVPETSPEMLDQSKDWTLVTSLKIF
jgi:hypothetical protein